jgi:hypothetical protein
MTIPISRIALGALILVNIALGAFAIQLAAGKVPIPESWAWTVPILQAVVVAATALLPRAGSEEIAGQVDALRAGGVPRSEMVVLSKDEAAPRLAGALSPDQMAQIVAGLADVLHGAVVDAVIARMQATPQPKDLPSDPVGHIEALLDQDEQARPETGV